LRTGVWIGGELNIFKRFVLNTIIKAVHPFNDLKDFLFASKNESEIKTYYDAYLKNLHIRKGVNMICDKISILPWGIYKNKEKDIHNPIVENIFKKNGYMTDVNFIRLTEFWAFIEGFTIIEYNTLTIRVFESHRITAESGALVYTDKHGKQENIVLERCGIIQCDPTEPFGLGHSKLEPLIGSVQRQSLLESALKNMLKNGAMPAFFMNNPNHVGTDATKTLADKFRDAYSGVRKAGKIPWVSGGWTPTKIGSGVNELNTKELSNITKNDVCTALGIPISLMNDTESSTASRDKMQEDRKALLYDTIIPEAEKLARFFTIFLIPIIGKGGGEWVFDYSLMADMVKDKLTQAQIDQIYINSRIYSPNEIREREGWAGYTGGDDILAPFNLAPIGALGEEKTLKLSNNQRGIIIKQLEKTVLDQRWKAYYAKAHSQELKTTKTLAKYFGEMEKKVLAGLKTKKYIPDEFKDLFFKTLKPLMTSFAQQAGDDMVEEYGLGYDFIVGRELQKYIELKLKDSASEVVSTCEKSIKKAIDKAMQEGLGSEEQAKLIQEAVKDKFGEFKRSNARRIARTEVNAINNKAGFTAADDGGMTEKHWLSARLDTSRDSHVEAEELNGWIKMNEDFIVGGVKMQMPGSSGVPEHDINCLCTVMYR
jgi:HK97 family phage portal protein